VGGTLDILIWLLAAVLLLLALAAAAIAVRRFLLERGGGTIECGLRFLSGSPGGSGASSRANGADGGTWRPGMAAYHRNELQWFGAVGIRLRPTWKFSRRSLNVVSRRLATAPEVGALGPGRAIVELDTGGASPDKIELAMTPEALTGFLSWLEASPPSSHLQDIA
jgi:hypothetical protein